MAEWFYALTNVVFKTYSEPTPVPTPTPVTPAEYLGNMALTQTGDFLGMFAILLAGILTVGTIFFLVNRGTIKTKTLAGVFTAIVLCGAGTSAALIANGAAQKMDVTSVPERIEVLNHLDGSGWEFGQSPYGKEQVFTNPTKDKIITIDGLGITSPDKENEKIDIGTWTCYSNDLGIEIFSGTIGTEAKLLSTITLYPGESTTFVWNSNISKEQALLLNETSPAIIGYRYSINDVPTPSDKHTLTVNLNGGEVSSEAQAKLNKDGWSAVSPAETGEVFYSKQIDNNYTKTEDAFMIWQSLLKDKQITKQGAIGNLIIDYKKEFIVDDVTANILYSIGPITGHTMEMHLNGGLITDKGLDVIEQAGWFEVASVDKGSYWTKTIYGDTYTPVDVFGVWQNLLKSGDVYIDGGGKGTLVLPAVQYIKTDLSLQVIWGVTPVLVTQGRASVANLGYIEGINVELLDKNINIIYSTTTDADGYYNIPMNTTSDDQYIRLYYTSGTKHFTCPDITFKPNSSKIDAVELVISAENNLEIVDFDSEKAIGGARIDIFMVTKEYIITNPNTDNNISGFTTLQGGILSSPVYHCLADEDGKLTVYTMRGTNGASYAQTIPYVVVTHEGYNMITSALMGYINNPNDIKFYSTIALSKIEKCYSISGNVADVTGVSLANELIGVSPQNTSGHIKKVPEIYSGITDEKGDYVIYIRPEIDGELSLSSPAFSKNMPYYVKHIARNTASAGTDIKNDIELTPFIITAHVSDNPDAEYSVYATDMWTRIESSGYDLQARFYKGSDIAYTLEGLWLSGQDEGSHPLWWEWSEETLTNDTTVNLIWTKDASLILEAQRDDEVYYTDAIKDVLTSVNASYQPALESFVFTCPDGTFGKEMYGTIMGVMEKAKALQGHTIIDSPEGYTLIGFDGLQNILNGYCSIYCCWNDDMANSSCNFYSGDATFSEAAQEYLIGKGYEVYSETSVGKDYPLGTAVNVPREEFIKVAREYEAETGNSLFTTHSDQDVFVNFDDLPGKLTVHTNDYVPVFKLFITFKATGSGHVVEGGKTVTLPIELYSIPYYVNGYEIDNANFIINSYNPNTGKMMTRTFTAVADSGSFSYWDVKELSSSFIWYSANVSPVFTSKVKADNVIKEQPAENALDRYSTIQKSESEAESAAPAESALDSLVNVAEDEATPEPVKWATTALWCIFSLFAII